MRFWLIISLLISFTAQPAWALGEDTLGSLERDTLSEREISSFVELLPDFREFECTPRCEGGAPECAQAKDIDSCLDPAVGQSCTWACR